MVRDIVVNLGLGARDPAGVYAISVAEAFEAHIFGAAVSLANPPFQETHSAAVCRGNF